MKLSDIMSNAGLSMYAEVALVLFLAAFVIIVIRTFLPSRKRELEATALLPLQDAPVLEPTATRTATSTAAPVSESHRTAEPPRRGGVDQ